MRSEKSIQDEISVEVCAQTGGIVLRLNSGEAWGGKLVNTTEYGPVVMNPRRIKLCPAGTPDLLAILPDGTVAWIECKNAKGKAREAQERFLSMMKSMGHKCGIARSVNDAMNIIGGK